MTPSPIPATNIANGTVASTDASGQVFTFSTVAGGSIAALTASTTTAQTLNSYFLTITGANGTPGNYQILSINSAASSAAVTSPGMAYNTGDIVTVLGGTSSTPSTWTVTQSGGGVTSLAQSAAGSYTVLPANPVRFSGGAGTGLTATITWTAPTLGLATSAGSSASNITWSLNQAYAILPNQLTGVMVDNNGYPLGQNGGLNMTAGTITCTSTGTNYPLMSTCTPCKFVLISPAAHNVYIGTKATPLALSYLATAPLFVSIPTCDASQVYITATTGGDAVGFAYFN